MALVAWQPLPQPLCVKENNILQSLTLKPGLKERKKGKIREIQVVGQIAHLM